MAIGGVFWRLQRPCRPALVHGYVHEARRLADLNSLSTPANPPSRPGRPGRLSFLVLSMGHTPPSHFPTMLIESPLRLYHLANVDRQAVWTWSWGTGQPCQLAGPNAGLKRVFHILDAGGGNRVQIPVFTGMTGFGAVTRVYGKDNAVNRRATYGSTLPWRLLKHAFETRPYGLSWRRNRNA